MTKSLGATVLTIGIVLVVCLWFCARHPAATPNADYDPGRVPQKVGRPATSTNAASFERTSVSEGSSYVTIKAVDSVTSLPIPDISLDQIENVAGGPGHEFVLVPRALLDGGAGFPVMAPRYIPTWLFVTKDMARGDVIEVRLTPGCSVSGVVQSSKGQPIDGAVVELASSRLPKSAGVVHSSWSAYGNGELAYSQVTLTDSEGRFTFSSVAPGRNSLRAEKSGWVNNHQHDHTNANGVPLDVAPGKQPDVVLWMFRVWKVAVTIENRSRFPYEVAPNLVQCDFGVPAGFVEVPPLLIAAAGADHEVERMEGGWRVWKYMLETELSVASDIIKGNCHIRKRLEDTAPRSIEVTWLPLGEVIVDTPPYVFEYNGPTGTLELHTQVRCVAQMLDASGSASRIQFDSGLDKPHVSFLVPVGTYMIRPVAGFAQTAFSPRNVDVKLGDRLVHIVDVEQGVGRMRVRVVDQIGERNDAVVVVIARGDMQGSIQLRAKDDYVDVDCAVGLYNVSIYSLLGKKIGASSVSVGTGLKETLIRVGA